VSQSTDPYVEHLGPFSGFAGAPAAMAAIRDGVVLMQIGAMWQLLARGLPVASDLPRASPSSAAISWPSLSLRASPKRQST
jgi:hypothetical protein